MAAPSGDLTTSEAIRIAREVGCTASVEVVESSRPNGMFVPKGIYPMGPWGMPVEIPADAIVVWHSGDDQLARFILLHELAHCLDFEKWGVTMADTNNPKNWPWYEWGADAQAMEWAPRYGVDPGVNAEALAELFGRNRRDDDPNEPHGAVQDRVLFNRWMLQRLYPMRDFQGA